MISVVSKTPEFVFVLATFSVSKLRSFLPYKKQLWGNVLLSKKSRMGLCFLQEKKFKMYYIVSTKGILVCDYIKSKSSLYAFEGPLEGLNT